jgi:hypothetical protein
MDFAYMTRLGGRAQRGIRWALIVHGSLVEFRAFD